MTDNTFDYDLVVIGAGSGGVRAARRAATQGAKVAIIERYRVGGTCVIRGCVPKKIMAYAGQIQDNFADADVFGWQMTAKPDFNWQHFRANLHREISALSAIYSRNLAAAGVDVFNGHGQIVDSHKVKVIATDTNIHNKDSDGNNNEQHSHLINARIILIATGGMPSMPDDISGVEHAITSNEVFLLDKLPDSILIIGGGYIAVEFASILNNLGVKATLSYRRNMILRSFDSEIQKFLSDSLINNGIELMLNSKVKAITRTKVGFDVVFNDDTSKRFDMVLAATGRKPAINDLNLENNGVNIDSNGGIMVDEYGQTTNKNIYAVGDVTGGLALTPIAIKQANAFAATIFANKATTVNYDYIPSAVFADPEVGTVGYSEQQASAQFKQVDVYSTSFTPMRYSFAKRDNKKMLIKVVVNATTDNVVGCHIVGPAAAEMTQMLAIALKGGIKKHDFDATIALHPSSAEEIVLLSEPIIRYVDGKKVE